MDFSEILQSINDALSRMRERMAFVMRSYRKTTVAVVVVLVGVSGWLVYSGFSLQLSKFFAAAPVDTGDGGGGSSTTTPLPSLPATTTVPSGPCRLWQGSSATNWAAVATPAGQPACAPLTRVDNATFPGYATAVWVEELGQMVTPPDLVPPPVNFADCLIIENRSSGDPNWGSMTENTVPQVLAGNANAKLTYKAFVINNCPWEAHLLFDVSGSPKAGFDLGPTGHPVAISGSEFGKAFAESTPPGRDFPSCWNTGSTSNRPASCGKEISFTYNLNAYTCGSLGVQLIWWHRTSDTGHQDDPRGVGFVSAINYGRDCSGSPVERAPGSGLNGGTGGAPGSTPGVGTHVASVLTVQCGATQNILRWTLPSNHDSNAVLKNIDGADGVSVNDPAIGFSTTTWTDRNVQSGHVYTYRHKAFADRTSNSVTCPTGAVPASPGVSPTTTPSTSTVPGGSSTPFPTISGQSTPTSSIIVFAPTPGGGVGAPTPSGQPGPVGSVPTGPGDATLLALIVSAVVSLAYVSYTHSSVGRRREIDYISKDQGPLDFRS